MTLLETIADAGRSIGARPLRSVLTMLGIAIGVGSLIVMLSIGSGAQTQVSAQIDSLGANILMVLPGVDRDVRDTAVDRVRPALLTLADVLAVEDTPGVAAAAPSLWSRARVIAGNRNWVTEINGTTASYLAIRDWPLRAGRNFSDREEIGAGKVALIGSTVAQRLFGAADPIGSELRILNTPLRVIGVLDRKGPSGSGRDQDDIVFVPYTTAKSRLIAERRQISPDGISYILAKATSSSVMAATRANIDTALRQRHPAELDRDAGYRVIDPAAAMAARRGSTRTIGWLLAIVASTTLIVGGIGIMNTSLITVTERTREIGLRMALGARKRDIGRLFLFEALITSLVGGAIGIVVGVLVAWLVATTTDWPIRIASESLWAAFGFAGAVGLLFGYHPARKASLLAPAAALRRD